MGDTYKSTRALLERVIAESPRKKLEIEAQMKSVGGIIEIPLRIDPPSPAICMPTFARDTNRPLTPMLKARFDVAGKITRFYDEWLIPTQMENAMMRNDVPSTHVALREHWDTSAPKQFSDTQLSLFSFSPNVRGNVAYLVWKDAPEPELWKHKGMELKVFSNLANYFEWLLA